MRERERKKRDTFYREIGVKKRKKKKTESFTFISSERALCRRLAPRFVGHFIY